MSKLSNFQRGLLVLTFSTLGVASSFVRYGSKSSETEKSLPKSWVGETVVVDKDGDGFDFNSPYPNLGINDTFTVVTDDSTDNHDGIRLITFVDDKGHEGWGNASRFELVNE